MEPTSCIDCGNILSPYYDAFLLMKEIYVNKKKDNKVHVEKETIDPNMNLDLTEVFQVLKIEKYCCRSQLTGCMNMHNIII